MDIRRYDIVQADLSGSVGSEQGGVSVIDYGEHKSCLTPNGYWMCEGTWCKDAYDTYLDANETTENIVKYASVVKLMNKEEFNGNTIQI